MAGAFRLRGLLLALIGSAALAVCLPVVAQAMGAVQAAAPNAPAVPSVAAPTLFPAPIAAQDRSIADWLMRMHQATSKRAFIGTFVVSSANAMAASRSVRASVN